MRKTRIDDRFFESTRGKIVLLMRITDRTVDDLSKELGVTDNAIRANLLSLERDGLVFQNGLIKGFRKPHFIYSLTREAEDLFPKPFDAIFTETIGVLKKQFSPKKVVEVLRQIGREIGGRYRPAGKLNKNSRVEISLKALGDLGGVAEVARENGRTTIRGKNCPLAAAVTSHKEVCKLAESLVSEITGSDVIEICDRTGAPKCVFEVG
jgi:predicted ArsR family transcriptional regulator